MQEHNAEGFTVIVGATKKHDRKQGQHFKVINVYPHPKFRGHKGHLYHDVGILRLDGTIMLGKKYSTQIVQLPSQNEETPEGREIWVQGWGTNPQNRGDKRLYQSTMTVASGEKCYRSYDETLEEYNQHEVCAVPLDGKTCPGDSGTPAIDAETHKVVGLDSFSTGGGCDTLHPITFVRIIDNLDFINEIMDNNSTKNSHDDDVCDDDGDDD